MRGSHSLSARRARRTKLEVGAQRAPRLLFLNQMYLFHISSYFLDFFLSYFCPERRMYFCAPPSANGWHSWGGRVHFAHSRPANIMLLYITFILYTYLLFIVLLDHHIANSTKEWIKVQSNFEQWKTTEYFAVIFCAMPCSAFWASAVLMSQTETVTDINICPKVCDHRLAKMPLGHHYQDQK